MALISRLTALTRIRRGTDFLHKQQTNWLLLNSAVMQSTLRPRRVAVSGERERQLLQRDKVPANYELIYRAPMENYIAAIKAVTTITVSLVTVIAGIQVASPTIWPLSQEIDWHGLVVQESDLIYFGIGFVAINLILRIFISKYPLRIYKHLDKYIAVYDSQIPLSYHRNHFLQGEVTEVNNIFNPWSGSMYRLGKKSSMVLLDYFKTPSEFHQMCGLKH